MLNDVCAGHELFHCHGLGGCASLPIEPELLTHSSPNATNHLPLAFIGMCIVCMESGGRGECGEEWARTRARLT